MSLDRHRAVHLPALVFVAACAAPSVADAQSSELGRQQFQAGRSLFDAGRYADALEAFRASAASLPSPNTQLYVARCLRELGRPAEAWEAFQQAEREAQARSVTEARYAPTVAAAQRESALLLGRVAFVVLDGSALPPGASTALNGRQVDPGRMGRPQAIDPGGVTVTASAPGFQPFVATQQVAAGQHARVEVRLAAVGVAPAMAPTITVLSGSAPTGTVPMARPVEVSTGSGPWRVLGATAMGLGVALGVTGVLTGLRARSIEADLIDRCGTRGCEANFSNRSLVDEGNTMVTVTNVAWGVGAGLAVVGAVVFFASGPSRIEVFAPSLARRVSPGFDPRRGVLSLSGTF